MILHWLLIEPAFEHCGQMLQLWLHRVFGPDTDISKINTNPWSLIQWSLIGDPVIFDMVFPENCLLSKMITHLSIMTQLISAFSPTSHEMWTASWHCSHTNMLYLSLFQKSFHSQSWPLTTCAPGKIPLAWIASVLILLSMRILSILQDKENTLTSSIKNWKPPRKKSLIAKVWLGW